MEEKLIENKNVIVLNIAGIKPNDKNPFTLEDESYDALKRNIGKKGIATPITVYPEKKGGYRIISGHRRYFAAKELGMKTIPCLIMEQPKSDTEEKKMILSTNICRNSDGSRNELVKSAGELFDSFTDEQKKKEGERLKALFANDSRISKDDTILDRPRDLFVLEQTGLTLSSRQISRIINEPKAEEKKKEPATPKPKKIRTLANTSKAVVASLRFLTSEAAEVVLSEEEVADIEKVIEILNKYVEEE